MTVDGATAEPEDHARLSKQLTRVMAFMFDGSWHTLTEIARESKGSEAGVSARLRDLRKPRFGGYEIQRRRVQGGLFEYRLIVRGHATR